MILLLDTSEPTCRMTLIEKEGQFPYEWEAGRGLADGLLKYIKAKLREHGVTLQELKGVCVYRGPGSFTGLRIGITVCNTIADSLEIPIIGETGEDWQVSALHRLDANEDDKLVLPEYGRPANITKQRK